MEFIQQIKLKAVTANENAIFFKVNVNGEDRIFIGQQNDKFDIKIDDNLESTLDSDKLSSEIKLAESFQKAYIVDKKDIAKENIKKDVIIPCAVSKEIVQLGNMLYSLSQETNNRVLYLLYKNRLLNRYVDEATHMVYYDLNLEEFKNTDLEKLDPNVILQGVGVYPGLIDNFNREYEKHDDVGNIYYNTIDALEKDPAKVKSYYKNMDGYMEYLEDFNNVENRPYEMPFNMIYEYGEESQYENNQSTVYTDFIHLKNSLSPFFNVEVTDEYKFKLWRKYVKVSNLNYQLWSSYTLDTPKTITTKTNQNSPILNVGNNVSPAHYYNNVSMFCNNIANSFSANNLNTQGFTIHVDCPTKEIANRYIFSYNTRAAAKRNHLNNHLLQTTEEFAQWLIDNSNGLLYWKLGNSSKIKYPQGVHFSVDVFTDDASIDSYLEIACIENYDKSDLSILEELDYQIPGFINVLNFNYDSGEILSAGEASYKPFIKTSDQFYAELNYYNNKDYVYKWEKLLNEGDCYLHDEFKLEYKDGSSETFIHKTVSDAQSSTAVDSKEWVNSKVWTTKLVGSEKQFNDICRVLDILKEDYVPFKDGNNILQLTEAECNSLFRSTKTAAPAIESVISAKIEDEYSLAEFNKLSTAQRIKYLLTKLFENYTELPIDNTIAPPPQYFDGITNYHLCKANGYTTINDIISALYYYIEEKHLWKKGTKVKFKNYRISPYATTDFASDYVTDSNSYYLANDSDVRSIRYACTPFDIRYSLVGNSIDVSLSNQNSVSSIIDLFGITIGGKYVNDYEKYDSNVISTLMKADGTTLSIDLSISLKDEYQNDCLIVKSYINGQLINEYQYNPYDSEYSVIVNNINSINNIRFWVYGFNYTNEAGGLVTFPLNYYNVSMWNYPLNLGQIQLLRRMVLSKKSLYNFANDIYEIVNGEYIKIEDFTKDVNLYGKIFSIDRYITNVDYKFNSNKETIDNQKLYKIQDFEFVERINGINKLTPAMARKSNLYSVKLSNTGLAIDPDDDNETKKFKEAVTTSLKAAINTICSRAEPINTKLFSIIIDS